MPKSQTLTEPSDVSRTLDGLMSRCTISAPCTSAMPWTMPRRTGAAQRQVRSAMKRPASSRSRPWPATYSIAR